MTNIPFSSPPKDDRDYKVGDIVEANCDHDQDKDRIHGWLQGVIVQVDPKMIAVQFPENVYLTNGWMVPDHVLWYAKDSSQMRRPKRLARKSRVKW